MSGFSQSTDIFTKGILLFWPEKMDTSPSSLSYLLSFLMDQT